MASKRQIELEKEGWQRKTTTDEPRLSEFVALYESLGFEVLLQPIEAGDTGCTSCLDADRARFKTIYTRPVG